ncbi:hypothetical protein BW152_10275 [Lactococcus lactis]|uniref:hypothetical protein n=1 Tax=Lactococcus lactis TaxID=1358 RepID=UPI000BF36BC0|nr:hypothetical protein [Lactococcus lactis]PFG80297.1 hypothetical protein BW152_10275 [Lactococcus lactis]
MKLSKNTKDVIKVLLLLGVAVQFADYALVLLNKLPSYPMDKIVKIIVCSVVAGFIGYFLLLVLWDKEK